MKHSLISAITVTACLAGFFPTTGTAADKPMHPVVEQLDLDGDFILYLNTESIEERAFEFIDQILEIGAAASSANKAGAAEGMELIKSTLEWSGLLSMEAFAMSMAPADNDLTRMISVAQHDDDDESKALWRLLGSAPRKLKGIHYAPAHAVYVANSTTSFNEIWTLVNEGVAEVGGPDAEAAFNQQLMAAQILIGTNISAITESIEADLLLSVQLSDEKTIDIPQAQGNTLSFPEPDVLLGFGVKNGTLKELILQKVQLLGIPIVKATHQTFELNTLTLPPGATPITLSPTLVMTDDYLLIGTTLDSVKAALDAYTGSSGITTTDTYKKLLSSAPEKVSSLEFVSPRFGKAYADFFNTALTDAQLPERAIMLEIMTENMQEMYSGSFALKTPTGFYSEGLMNYGGAKPAEMMGATYAGMIAAIAVPSFQKARANAMEKSCKNNRRIIEAAKEQWAMEHGKPDGTPVSEADISPYIKGGFSSLTCGKSGTYTINPIGTDSTCSVYSPTKSNNKNVKRSATDKHIPTARIIGRKGAKHAFVIDRSGVIVTSMANHESLPLINGLDIDLSPGKFGSADVETALEIIDLCDNVDYLNNYIRLKSLDLSYSDFIDMRLAEDIRVRMPRTSLKPKLQNLATVIKISNGQGKRVKEVDLTLDTAKVPVTYH